MTKFIVEVDSGRAKEIQFEFDNNEIWIGGWGEDKAPVDFLRRVTKSLINDTADQIMDIVTEGGHGETQLMMYRDEVRRVIKVMLFS